MNKDIDPIQKIDSYLQGDLNSEEIAAFEKQLSNDSELCLDLDSTKHAIEAISGYAFKQKLMGIRDDYKKTKRSKSIQLYYLSGIAASLVLILIAYFWYPTPSNRFYSYFVPYASPVNVRSGNESNTLRAAFEHYEHGQYDKAIVDFEKLNQKDLTEETKFYQAISYLAQHNPKAASKIFINLDGEQYHEQVSWYLSLCYLLSNEKEKATAILKKIQPNDYSYEKAQEILSQL
jgi:tetratricopeptide (TPR) repeat protein